MARIHRTDRTDCTNTLATFRYRQEVLGYFIHEMTGTAIKLILQRHFGLGAELKERCHRQLRIVVVCFPDGESLDLVVRFESYRTVQPSLWSILNLVYTVFFLTGQSMLGFTLVL